MEKLLNLKKKSVTNSVADMIIQQPLFFGR